MGFGQDSGKQERGWEYWTLKKYLITMNVCIKTVQLKFKETESKQINLLTVHSKF